jgi:hypothetical protein
MYSESASELVSEETEMLPSDVVDDPADDVVETESFKLASSEFEVPELHDELLLLLLLLRSSLS